MVENAMNIVNCCLFEPLALAKKFKEVFFIVSNTLVVVLAELFVLVMASIELVEKSMVLVVDSISFEIVEKIVSDVVIS